MKECNSSQPTKRPCKVCGKKVSKKNGVQCQGKCQSWVHYSCLNFDDKQINDIKSGFIKIRCPCPACSNIKNIQATLEEPNNNQVIQCQIEPFTKHVGKEVKGYKKPVISCVIHEDSKESVYVAHSSYDDIVNDRNIEQLKDHLKNLPWDVTSPADEKLDAPKAKCVNCHAIGPYNVNPCNVFSTSGSSLNTRPKKRGRNQSLIIAMENVCHTVGLLSNQIRELMGRMGK